MEGAPNHNTIAFVRRASLALDKWWQDSDELHRQSGDGNELLREMLRSELHYSKLWLICVALRGTSWDKMPFDQRELAFQAKDSASSCLAMFLNSPGYRAALRYAVHDSLVMAAFSGLFLLKMANLFPDDLDLSAIMVQVEQAAQLLSEVAAERYALTLRLMLANLRKHNKSIASQGVVPAMGTDNSLRSAQNRNAANVLTSFNMDATVPYTPEELGMNWSAHVNQSQIMPSAMPVWLQEGNFADLGLPPDGLDGVFFPGPITGWPTELDPMPEAW